MTKIDFWAKHFFSTVYPADLVALFLSYPQKAINMIRLYWIFCVKHKWCCQMLEKLFVVFFHSIKIPCLAPKFHELIQSQKALNGLLWCFCFCLIIWLLNLLSICLVWYEVTIWRIQMILIIRDSDNGFILVQTKREMKSGKVSDP